MTEDARKVSPSDLAAFIQDMHLNLAAAESRMGLPPETLMGLMEDPDHLFVIKIIASIEPALNDLIEHELFRPNGLGGQKNSDRFRRLADFAASKLPLNGRASKLEFADCFGILSDQHKDFISAIAGIRNRYAHNIRNLPRSLLEVFKELEPRDRKLFRKLVGFDAKHDTIASDALKLLTLNQFSQFMLFVNKEIEVKPAGLFALLGDHLTNSASPVDDRE